MVCDHLHSLLIQLKSRLKIILTIFLLPLYKIAIRINIACRIYFLFKEINDFMQSVIYVIMFLCYVNCICLIMYFSMSRKQ